jgi:dihydropyrimidinase
MVALGSTNPARIFGLYPRKGTIAVGADADIVIFDPSWQGVRSAKTHHSKADRSIFEGFHVKGRPTTVIVGGKVAFADGTLQLERGAGRFLTRKIEAHRAPQPAPIGSPGR